MESQGVGSHGGYKTRAIVSKMMEKITLLLLLLSHFSRVRLCATHRRQPTRLRPGILQARTLEWVAISPMHESEK